MRFPKVGCCTWIFAPDIHVVSFEAISKAIELGFKGIELIASSQRHMEEFYTKDNIRKILEICESKDLTISQFAILSGLIKGLASMDGTQKKNALEIFRRGVNIAKELNTKIVNTVSHWPEIETPYWYAPNYMHPIQADYEKFDFKLTIKLPNEVKDWKKFWQNYVDSIGMCTDIAADEGLYFSLEAHVHSIISGTDAFLLLFREVKSNRLGVNMDTGWHFAKREYIPMSIYKLGDRLLNMHVRDSDGLLSYNLPPGLGIINWMEVVKALKEIGYSGFMDLEIQAYGCEEYEKYVKKARGYLESLTKPKLTVPKTEPKQSML